MNSTAAMPGALPGVVGNQVSTKTIQCDAALVFGVALIARLLALPFTTFDSADSATRVWLAWQWLDHPYVITEGVWGPLHFYLIGAALYLWPDPVWAPISLHVLLGALVPIVAYLFVEEVFRERRPAILAGIAFAVYPTAIAISVLPTSETPFSLFLGLSLLFLARTRRLKESMWNPVLAGITIGLASMLRYEAWLLLPFLTLLVMKRPKQAAAFLTLALLHPVFWMVGNYMAHGDPFFSISWAANWERTSMGNAADVTLSNVIAAIWSLVETTERGLSFPLSLLVTIGVIGSIFRRRRERLWLIPPLGLFLLFVGAATGGSLLVKWQYTVTYGLLLMPFLAYSCYVLGVEQWPRSRFVAAIAGLILLVAVSTIEPLWKGVPGGGQFFARAAPDFLSQTQAAEVLSLVNAGRTAGHDALVTDFYGWRPSYYVALHTMLHPDRICTTNGAPNVPLDVAGFRDFLAEHPKGVLITQDRGRLTSLLHRQPDGSVKLENLALQIEPLGEVLLPLPGSTDDIVIGVGRYTVMGSADIRMGRSTASDRCASSCVTDLCRRD